MLVLDRKTEEGFWIGEHIFVKVLDIRPQRVKLGIKAASDLDIAREELRLHSDGQAGAETGRREREKGASTDRRPLQEALLRSEASNQALLDAIPDMVFQLSREGRFLGFVPAKGQEPALPTAEFLGRTMPEVLPADLAREAMGHIQRALLTGDTQVFEYQLPSPLQGGNVREYEARVAASGRNEVLIIARDITERKRAEETLRIQRDLAIALSSAADLDETMHLCLDAAIRVSGLDSGCVYLVDRSSGAFDLACHEGLGDRFLKAVARHEADSANARTVMAGKPFYTRYDELGVSIDEPRRREGLRAIAVIPVQHEGEVIACLCVTSHSLDEVPPASQSALETIAAQVGGAIARSRVQEALRESEERLRTLVANAPVILFAIDREGVFTVAEGRGMTPVGLRPDQHVGRSVFDVYSNTTGVMDAARRALAGEAFSETVETEKRVFEAHITPLRDGSGKITGAVAIATDVTERQRAEEALRESEQRFRILSEATLEGIVIDDSAAVLDANPQVAAMVGCELHEFLGKNPLSFVAPESRDLVRQHVTSAHEGFIEALALRKDGTAFPIEVRGRVAFYQGREVRVSVVRDRTERKQAQETLHERERRLRAVVENAPVGLFAMDREGVITLSEGKAQEAMGLKASEHVGLSMFDVYRDFPGIIEGTRRVLAGEAMTARIRLGRVLLEVRTTPVQDKDGKITGAIGVATDVTERKRAEDALRASEEMWRSLVENSPDIIMNVGPDGTILLINRTLPGFPPPEQIVGTSVYDFIPSQDHDTMRRSLERVFETGESDSFETAGAGPHRTTSHYETRVAPVKHDGEVASVHLIATDVTQRKRAEEALQRAREELEARVERQMERGRAHGLTFRELTVLHLVAAGRADKEIADELGISPRTASKHVENILQKMGATSRTEAGIRALQEGLVGQPD